MVYLPTLTFTINNQPNVDEYAIHGSYGNSVNYSHFKRIKQCLTLISWRFHLKKGCQIWYPEIILRKPLPSTWHMLHKHNKTCIYIKHDIFWLFNIWALCIKTVKTKKPMLGHVAFAVIFQPLHVQRSGHIPQSGQWEGAPSSQGAWATFFCQRRNTSW